MKRAVVHRMYLPSRSLGGVGGRVLGGSPEWPKAPSFLGGSGCLSTVLKDVRPHCYCAFFRACHAHHEGKHDAKGKTFSTRMERESVWHHGIAVNPGLLGNVTQCRDSANIQSL